jgi:hypothetical protein
VQDMREIPPLGYASVGMTHWDDGPITATARMPLGGLALPEIDLGGIVPGVAPGTSLAISPTALERLFGFTELTAELN